MSALLLLLVPLGLVVVVGPLVVLLVCFLWLRRRFLGGQTGRYLRQGGHL